MIIHSAIRNIGNTRMLIQSPQDLAKNCIKLDLGNYKVTTRNFNKNITLDRAIHVSKIMNQKLKYQVTVINQNRLCDVQETKKLTGIKSVTGSEDS